MRIAYIDCFSGISGDMFLGALIDAGVSAELLIKMAASLDLGARLEISRVSRSGISATKVDVLVNGEKELPRDEFYASQEHSSETNHAGHRHHHAHAPSEGRDGELQHNLTAPGTSLLGSHVHGDEPHGRTLPEIRSIIEKTAISAAARRTAIAIFDALGAAEAKIHNVNIESMHFHEVGAIDALVDIVGAAVAAEALAADEIVCSPLNVGGGTVKCAHGVFPVPAPATVELLKDVPVYSSGIEKELVTPTGAAIVKTLATRFGTFPEMKIERAGYGAGTRDIVGHANVVRLTVGEAAIPDAPRQDLASRASAITHTLADNITVLEANLDDLNPQVFGYVMGRLLEEGALDAFAAPVQMKKNRPGTLLTVLCKPGDAASLTQLLFTETTTLGVRRRDEERQTLARRWVTVATPWGNVRMKVASMNGTDTNYAPEYEDCRRIAVEYHVPLKIVLQEATQAYLKGIR
jgi:pyridinium-3,5-bisthiocarboxylic acid mononucleotide nickel chelatase